MEYPSNSLQTTSNATDAAPEDSPRKHPWLRRLTWALSLLLLLGGLGLYFGYRAFTWIPRDYERQLVLSPAVLELASDELEQRVLNLHADVQETELWEATFTDEQINGWLAVDLRKKFPRLLPYNIRQPRVSFSSDLAQIACQYQSPKMASVLSLDVDAYVTDEENVIGIRIRSARIGAVPGLVKLAVDEISQAAKRGGIKLQWAQQDGDPVALITIPADVIDDRYEFIIQNIELSKGQVHIAGRTVEAGSSPRPAIPLAERQAPEADSDQARQTARRMLLRTLRANQ